MRLFPHTKKKLLPRTTGDGFQIKIGQIYTIVVLLFSSIYHCREPSSPNCNYSRFPLHDLDFNSFLFNYAPLLEVLCVYEIHLICNLVSLALFRYIRNPQFVSVWFPFPEITSFGNTFYTSRLRYKYTMYNLITRALLYLFLVWRYFD